MEEERNPLCCAPYSFLSGLPHGCMRQRIRMLSAPSGRLQCCCQLLCRGALPAIDRAVGVTSMQLRSGPDSHQQDSFDNKDAYVRCFKRSLLLIW